MDLLAIASKTGRASFLALTERTLDKQRDRLIDLATTPLATILLGSGSKFLIDFSIAVLKSVLESQDTLKEIRDQVRALVKEPLETGLGLVSTLSSLNPRSEADRAYITERYRMALGHLDRAYTLALPDERPILLLLRAVVALQINGGAIEAAQHFSDLAAACDKSANDHEASIPILESEAAAWEAEAAKIVTSASGLFAGTGLAMWEETNLWQRKGDLQRRAKLNRQLADERRHTILDLRESALVLHKLAEISAEEPDT